MQLDVLAGAVVREESEREPCDSCTLCLRSRVEFQAPRQSGSFLSIPERGLFAVFDGVGGQRAGEVASQTAADTVEER